MKKLLNDVPSNWIVTDTSVASATYSRGRKKRRASALQRQPESPLKDMGIPAQINTRGRARSRGRGRGRARGRACSRVGERRIGTETNFGGSDACDPMTGRVRDISTAFQKGC